MANDGKKTTIVNEFEDLPIASLISSPLIATIDAQKQMSIAMSNFIKEVGLDEKGQIKTVDFKYKSLENTSPTDGTAPVLIEKERVITAPFLAMTGIPNLAVETVTVDFEMEVSTSEQNHSETEESFTASGGGFLWVPKMTGSVTHKSEQTRKTDTRAKYTVHVEAKKQATPETLMRIIDFITDEITKPVDKNDKDKLEAPAASANKEEAKLSEKKK